jgi:hypothetical protein
MAQFPIDEPSVFRYAHASKWSLSAYLSNSLQTCSHLQHRARSTRTPHFIFFSNTTRNDGTILPHVQTSIRPLLRTRTQCACADAGMTLLRRPSPGSPFALFTSFHDQHDCRATSIAPLRHYPRRALRPCRHSLHVPLVVLPPLLR